MNFTFCDVVQHTLIVLEFLSNFQCKNHKNPSITSAKCQSNITNQFSSKFYTMIDTMKININTQISKQIHELNQQPDYNYINYFKDNLEFTARFVLNRIEKAFEEINYDQFFSTVNDCNVCDDRNLTSRNCLNDSKFKINFIKSGIQMFNVYPLNVEKRKFEIVYEFKKENDVKIFIDLYNSFLNMFNRTNLIELRMKNMIKNRFEECCNLNLKDLDDKNKSNKTKIIENNNKISKN